MEKETNLWCRCKNLLLCQPLWSALKQKGHHGGDNGGCTSGTLSRSPSLPSVGIVLQSGGKYRKTLHIKSRGVEQLKNPDLWTHITYIHICSFMLLTFRNKSLYIVWVKRLKTATNTFLLKRHTFRKVKMKVTNVWVWVIMSLYCMWYCDRLSIPSLLQMTPGVGWTFIIFLLYLHIKEMFNVMWMLILK